MAYNGNWIAELTPTDPLGTEAKSFGDDAIREVKRALTNAFPNSPAGDSYDGTLSQLNDLVDGQTLPFNTIIMWTGNINSSPTGWTVCDGRSRPGGGNAPDFTTRFPLGADPADTVFAPGDGTTGGNSETDIRGLGGSLVQFTTNGHALTPAELPDISGNITAAMAPSTQSDDHTRDTFARGSTDGVENLFNNIASLGLNNQAHSHTFTISGSGTTTGSNMPPYIGVYFLIKD